MPPDPLPRVLVIHGADELMKRQRIAEIKSACLDEAFADFDLDTLEAGRSAPQAIAASSNQAPFGSPKRLVIVTGAEYYRRRENAAQAEQLAELMEGLGSLTCLVLVCTAPPPDRAKTKTVLTAKLDAAVSKAGAMIECAAPEVGDLAQWLGQQCEMLGKRLEPAAAMRLAELGDRMRSQMELDKAINYAGEASVITRAMVDATRSFDPEDVMFKLIDAVFDQIPNLALTSLRTMYRHEEKPHALVARLLPMLSRQLRLVWQARQLSEAGMPAGSLRNLPQEMQEQLAADPRIASMAWKGRDLYRMAGKWEYQRLAAAQALLLECDLATKGGEGVSEDPLTCLESLVSSLAYGAAPTQSI